MLLDSQNKPVDSKKEYRKAVNMYLLPGDDFRIFQPVSLKLIKGKQWRNSRFTYRGMHCASTDSRRGWSSPGDRGRMLEHGRTADAY